MNLDRAGEFYDFSSKICLSGPQKLQVGPIHEDITYIFVKNVAGITALIFATIGDDDWMLYISANQTGEFICWDKNLRTIACSSVLPEDCVSCLSFSDILVETRKIAARRNMIDLLKSL